MSDIRQLLLDIVAPRRRRVLLIMVAICASAGLEVLPPLILKRIIDGHLVPGIAAGLWALAAFYLAVIAGQQVIGFVASYLTASTAQGALRDLRVRLYAHLQRLPMQYFDTHPLGDTISRCTADVDTIDTLFTSGVAGLITDLIRLVTISIAMVFLSPPLALLAVLVMPPMVWVTNLFRKRIRDAQRRTRIAVGLLNTNLQETIGGIEVIRAFGREPVFTSRLRQVLAQMLQAFCHGARFACWYAPIMKCLMATIIALLLWVGTGGTLVAFDLTFLGTLTAFVLLFERFFDPISSLGEEWQTVQSALSGVERISQVLLVPEEDRSIRHAPPDDSACAGIEIHEIVFGYQPGHEILRKISLAVRPGEHVALVGRTGSGKTTLLSLLGGLYQPWEGSVRVAGLDPRLLSNEERRKIIGVVPQQVQLFSGTVLQNLTLGDTNVPLGAVQAAAQIAGADAFIRTLPQGYDTPLSSVRGDGVQLSSGQRQLLSLVRALVWNPAVLILDEATSAIDSASEAAFRQALLIETEIRQHAILTVAHRLSTAREADRVIVMDSGRIVEQGRPEDLIEREGYFAAVLQLEAIGWDRPDEAPGDDRR